MLAGVEVFIFSVGVAALDQIRHGRRQHLRVDAEVVFLLQILPHRVRQSADAKLDAVAVADHVGHIAADLFLHLRRDRALDGEKGRVRNEKGRDPLDGNVQTAAHAAKARIDLENDLVRAFIGLALEHLAVGDLEAAVLHIGHLRHKDVVRPVAHALGHIVVQSEGM